MSSNPVVVVVRHPDYADDIGTFGDVDVYYLDMGSSFDVTHLGRVRNDEPDEDQWSAIEWCRYHLAEADACDNEAAAAYIRSSVESVADVMELTVEQVLAFNDDEVEAHQ